MSNTFLLIALIVSVIVNIVVVFELCRHMDKQIMHLAFLIHEFNLESKQRHEEEKELDNFKVGSLKYILVGTRLYIKAIMEKSAHEERYEDAIRCQNAIKEITKLINY